MHVSSLSSAFTRPGILGDFLGPGHVSKLPASQCSQRLFIQSPAPFYYLSEPTLGFGSAVFLDAFVAAPASGLSDSDDHF